MFPNKKILSTAISTCLLASIAFSVQAEQTELEQLVVTATRTPTPIHNIGSSVTVISEAEIEKKQFQTLSDALKHVPGLRVVELGGRGSQTSVFARGTNSNHTLVLVDGIEINDPSSPTGAFDFAHFLLDDVESIEVVRGSQSVLYGADAIGSVIQIRTRQGQGRLKTRAKVEAGTKSTHHETLALSGSNGDFNYSITGGLFESDGDSIATEKRLAPGSIKDDDGYNSKVVSARMGWDISSQLSSRVTARYIDSDTDIDGGFDFSGNTAEDLDAENKTRQLYLGAELAGNFFSGMWQPTLLFTHTDVERKNRNDRQDPFGTLDRSNYDGEKNKISLQNDLYFIHNNLITVGYEFEEEKMQADGFTDFGGFIQTQLTDETRQNRAVYIQDQITLTDRLNTTLGVRHDNTDDFDSETTYRITANYQLTDSSRVRAAHGTGFRAPSLYELFGFTPTNFGSAYMGNPDLDAETSENWEVGIDQSWFNHRLDSSVTIFKNDIDDLITTVFLPSFDSTSVNQNKADIHGAEAVFSLAATSQLDFNLNYTFTRTEDDNDQALLRRPKHLANFDVEYRPTNKLTLTGTLNYIGSRKDVDGVGQRVRMGSYTVVNLAANYQLNTNTRLFGRVENLADKEYEAAYGFQGTGITGIVGVEIANY
ncbi:TonB-dependent receptor plug domain-containing protein [Methylophaga sp. OBS4]|uniref:TonB-dependent receptor plug domain-containing protein n=1 Tax=Methylophaga sp. OBS4 TaxID=2991935 RepID=UPI002256A734|nr:TonB-dependent receptor [Methylophaga sp. OBS4]MCX4187718.1 TonB-dependent receptor [Methylophaga sp. OBS4]MCX4187763.1 TonB-dependent receptor [Methylophaga sp. OBS4]